MSALMRLAAAFAAVLAGPLTAGPIELDGWTLQPVASCTARAGRVAAHPTYDAAARADLARDPMLSLKPDYYDMPAHLHFDLSACYGPSGLFDAGLRVLPVSDYLHILDDGRTPGTHMAKQFDTLRHWLSGKPDAVAVWPLVPFLDMSPQFTVQRRALRFHGGRGIRVVTQFVPDAGFATSGLVSYVFQGLSDDGRSFVLLTVPLTIDGAAADGAREHLGFTLEQLDRNAAAAQRYERAVDALLARSGTKPALTELDALVESLSNKTGQPGKSATDKQPAAEAATSVSK
ncbi:MAG: hypothetical protein JNN30_02335 [Rhodanobacteraceae bacterium]|nr:hypothetical protein [Rhodanobacteraceae bacterium]